MPTLSQLSSGSRSMAKWGGITLGTIIFLFVLFKLGAVIKELLYPTPPAPPTVGYGKLPQIDFPKQGALRNFSYSVDTVSGNLPDFPDRINVYKMIKPQPDLLALKKAQEKIVKLQLNTSPNLISKNIYQWVTPQPFSKTLTYNIFTLDFTLTSSYLTDSNVATGKNFPTDETTILTTAKDFLSAINSLPDDLDLERIKIDFLSIKNYVLIPTTSISGAQGARVYYFQKSIDKLPIFYANPNISPISLLVTGGENQPQVAEVKFTHQKASTEKAETYALKTASEALENLKNGDGFIALSSDKNNNISITNIYLAYYISENKQDYLMPIVVFEGNDNFFAYVSAIKDEWINK
jgi:hypothetical protein